MTFVEKLKSVRDRIDKHLQSILSEYPKSELLEAMEYALWGGKRVRGFLVVESAKMFGLEGVGPLQVACAIECMHAYSLVHDDLPCMDDDDFRRNRASLHKAFNETVAVLAGDALQTAAFEIVSHPNTSPDPEVRAKLALTLATASGADGMVLGQSLDLAANADKGSLSEKDVLFLQAKKTGALLSWSAQSGAILSKQDPTPLLDYANSIGLAYQIADDLLDEDEKDSEGGNLLNVLGTQEAKLKAKNEINLACAALEPFGERANTLQRLARYVIERKY